MNKDQHDIDKLFQDAFGNYEATPPFNMWDKIEGSLPLTETDILFKKALENYEREPSAEVWERIQPELPLSLTVRNMFVQLSKVAAVLLVGITVYVFTQQFDWSGNENIAQQEIVTEDANNQQVAQQEVIEISVDELVENDQIAMVDASETTTTPAEKPNRIYNESPYNNLENTPKGGGAIYANYPTEATINVNEIARRVKNGDKSRIPSSELFYLNYWEAEEEKSKVDTLTKDQKEELKNLNNKRMEDVYAANEMLDFDGKIRRPKVTNAVAENNTSPLYLSLQGKSDASMTHSGIRINRRNLAPEVFNFKGFYVSANAALGNSFMLNEKMKNGVMGETANYNLASLGSNFGLGLGYQMSPKLSIETGLNYVNQNQTYTNSENGDVINLNYYAVPVTMKYRTNEISNRKPSSISYVFGVQTAFLETVEINNIVPSQFDQPHDVAIQTELGVTLGLDYDLYLNKNLSWTIGGRINYGTDIANPFENNNAFIGVRSAFNFRFAK